MGYTHRWKLRMAPTDAEFKAFRRDVRAIIESASATIPIQREYDDASPPYIKGDMVAFNGVGDDGHETFVLRRAATTFDFCKTARKPYDAVVVACLLSAQSCFLGTAIRIGSDGDWEEWSEGRALYERATGRAPIQPVEVRT